MQKAPEGATFAVLTPSGWRITAPQSPLQHQQCSPWARPVPEARAPRRQRELAVGAPQLNNRAEQLAAPRAAPRRLLERHPRAAQTGRGARGGRVGKQLPRRASLRRTSRSPGGNRPLPAPLALPLATRAARWKIAPSAQLLRWPEHPAGRRQSKGSSTQSRS